MIFCKWYVPENLNLNLVKIIENMALAVNNHSRDVLVKIFNAGDEHKSKFENLIEIFKPADIWHLFGDHEPLIWKIVKMHSKTVHTPIKNLFALNANNFISPAFGSVNLHSGESDKAIYIDENLKFDENINNNFPVINLSGQNNKNIPSEILSGIYITFDNSELTALRAGLLTMRGLCVASVKSEYLNEILGPDGYFMIEDERDITRIIRQGMGERGRNLAVSARHFIHTRRSDEKCAESVINLYREIVGENKK